MHHADDGVIPVDEAPEVLQMLKEPEGDRLFGGVCWHADVTFESPPAICLRFTRSNFRLLGAIRSLPVR